MDALWLIIFIGFILFKVLGSKLPEITDKLPKDWEQENWPSPKDFKPPWDEPTTRSPQRSKVTNTRKQDRRNKKYQSVHREGPPPEKEADSPKDIPAVTDLKETVESQENPLFNSQSVINGIIFSELLQPPKAKRK